MADDESGGLFCIAISDSEGEDAKDVKKRTGQSEEAFQAVKASYTPKVENGEVWKGVQFPVQGDNVKQQVLEMMHAIEELYFFRRYEEGARFARRVLEEGGPAVDEEHASVVRHYETKCLQRMGSTTAAVTTSA